MIQYNIHWTLEFETLPLWIADIYTLRSGKTSFGEIKTSKNADFVGDLLQI